MYQFFHSEFQRFQELVSIFVDHITCKWMDRTPLNLVDRKRGLKIMKCAYLAKPVPCFLKFSLYPFGQINVISRHVCPCVS
jgi:hypothetical protein